MATQGLSPGPEWPYTPGLDAGWHQKVLAIYVGIMIGGGGERKVLHFLSELHILY